MNVSFTKSKSTETLKKKRSHFERKDINRESPKREEEFLRKKKWQKKQRLQL